MLRAMQLLGQQKERVNDAKEYVLEQRNFWRLLACKGRCCWYRMQTFAAGLVAVRDESSLNGTSQNYQIGRQDRRSSSST